MYGIEFNGKFLKKSGTSFCSFPEDAKAFRTPQDAQDYIDYWLKDLGVSVCSLPLKDDELDENKNIVKLNESQLRQIVAESVKKVLKEYNHNVEDWWRHNGSFDREQASGIPYMGDDNYLQKTDEWWESLSDKAKMEIYNEYFNEY